MTTLSIATSARIGSSRCGSPKPCPTHSQSRQSVVPRPTIPASSYELGPIRSAYGHRDRRDSRGGSGNLFGNKVSSDRSVGNSMTKIARMTPTIPRGTVIGKRTGGPPLIEVEHFHKCTKRAAVGSICAISPRCLTTRNRCRILRKIRRNSSKKTGPGFPRPDPIRRATYIRPCCHRGFILSWRSRCQIVAGNSPLIAPFCRTFSSPFSAPPPDCDMPWRDSTSSPTFQRRMSSAPFTRPFLPACAKT